MGLLGLFGSCCSPSAAAVKQPAPSRPADFAEQPSSQERAREASCQPALQLEPQPQLQQQLQQQSQQQQQQLQQDKSELHAYVQLHAASPSGKAATEEEEPAVARDDVAVQGDDAAVAATAGRSSSSSAAAATTATSAGVAHAHDAPATAADGATAVGTRVCDLVSQLQQVCVLAGEWIEKEMYSHAGRPG